MTALIIAFAAFTLLLGFYLWWTFGWRRHEALDRLPGAPLAAFVSLIGLVWAGGGELLSRPKPLALEWRRPVQAEVLAARLVEGTAIYLWLALPDDGEPRAYVLPWSLGLARQIVEALRAGGQARGIMIDRPFDLEQSREDGETLLHPPPPPEAPPKDDQGTPEIFRRDL